MIMYSNTRDYYAYMRAQVYSCNNISNDVKSFLDMLLHQKYQQDKYSKPVPWIGMYVVLASLLCILAMVADLIHGLRNRKLWFPCKYFTMNAASLTVIAVAMKLPLDLNNSMPGNVDKAAKLGSLGFMCTMMVNFLPSLATTGSKELFTNIIALDILVITLLVNVWIEINTGVVGNYNYRYEAFFQVSFLLMLLIIQTCSALTILKSKQILESKYQAGHETALQELEQERLTPEKLKQHVQNHWIMAGTGSPEFITACSPTTSASGVICVTSIFIHVAIFLSAKGGSHFDSDYKWSTPIILITQFIGVLLGTIAPLSRCFAALSFKLSIKWIWNHINVFTVESYWTQMLCDWKQSTIPFSFGSRKSKIVFQFFKILFLRFCIGFQKTVVVVCKMIALIPIFFVICVLYCIRCWKSVKAMFSGSGIVSVKNPEQLENNKHSRRYVLQIQDDMEVAERTLKLITKSVNDVIQKAEKQQPKKLMKLLQESNGFEGVGKYDSHHVPPLSTKDYLDCWSLALVTLTTIAISLPKIQNKKVDSLLSSVSEGITYAVLVEESLNASDEFVSIQKATKMLWLEVEVSHKWLGNKLKVSASGMNTPEQILEWFRETAKNIFTEVENMGIESSNENLLFRSISANSMYRITQTILLSSYQDNIDEVKVTQEELFMQLSSMISDILAACLTNLPQVIAMKCHTNVIEKREASVQAAARLLGETSQMLSILQERELPSLNSDELPFINKWHACLHNPYP